MLLFRFIVMVLSQDEVLATLLVLAVLNRGANTHIRMGNKTLHRSICDGTLFRYLILYGLALGIDST